MLARTFPAALLTLLIPSLAAAGPVRIQLRGNLTFISDAPLEKIEGTADGVRGTITADPENLTLTTGSFRVPVAALKTGSPIRDHHLKGEDWLDARAHPHLKFQITKVRIDQAKRNNGLLFARGKVSGVFTLHGVDQRIEAPVKVKWKGERVKAKVRFTLRLADFRIKGQSGIIGKKVGKSVVISGVLHGRVTGGGGTS